jgi:hypothetical protein
MIGNRIVPDRRKQPCWKVQEEDGRTEEEDEKRQAGRRY